MKVLDPVLEIRAVGGAPLPRPVFGGGGGLRVPRDGPLERPPDPDAQPRNACLVAFAEDVLAAARAVGPNCEVARRVDRDGGATADRRDRDDRERQVGPADLAFPFVSA